MIDPIEAFVQFCLADTTFRAQVAGRVCGAPPGLSGLANAAFTPAGIPYPSLVVSMGAGSMLDHIPVMQPTLYLRAYAPDAYTAHTILTRLYDLLYYTSGELAGRMRENITIAGRWFMYYARISTLSTPTLEPQSQWPVAYAVIQAKFDSLRGA